MTQSTRQEIIRAHETLSSLCNSLEMGYRFNTATIKASEDAIKKALPPLPRPTMAEVEWDNDKHYLAEAEHSEYGKVVMVGLDENGLVEFFLPRFCANRCHKVAREDLTPTGKRYTLTEVQE